MISRIWPWPFLEVMKSWYKSEYQDTVYFPLPTTEPLFKRQTSKSSSNHPKCVLYANFGLYFIHRKAKVDFPRSILPQARGISAMHKEITKLNATLTAVNIHVNISSKKKTRGGALYHSDFKCKCQTHYSHLKHLSS